MKTAEKNIIIILQGGTAHKDAVNMSFLVMHMQALGCLLEAWRTEKAAGTLAHMYYTYARITNLHFCITHGL